MIRRVGGRYRRYFFEEQAVQSNIGSTTTDREQDYLIDRWVVIINIELPFDKAGRARKIRNDTRTDWEVDRD